MPHQMFNTFIQTHTHTPKHAPRRRPLRVVLQLLQECPAAVPVDVAHVALHQHAGRPAVCIF